MVNFLERLGGSGDYWKADRGFDITGVVQTFLENADFGL